MATRVLQNPVYCGPGGPHQRKGRGGPEEAALFPEGAAQAWTAGGLVLFDASSKSLLEATPGTTTTGLFAQAMAAATGVTAAAPPILFAIDKDDEFYMNVYHATPASAISDRNMFGVRYKVAVVSHAFVLDLVGTTIEDSTNAFPFVKVIGFHPDDVIGTDIYPRVKVRFGGFSIATDGSPQNPILEG